MTATTWAHTTPWPNPQPITPSEGLATAPLATPLAPPAAPPLAPEVVRPRPEPLALHGQPFPGDWSVQGSCRGANPELFLPRRGEDQSRAMGICEACPVRLPCLQYALGISGLQGIWGATNERQRRNLRRGQELSA